MTRFVGIVFLAAVAGGALCAEALEDILGREGIETALLLLQLRQTLPLVAGAAGGVAVAAFVAWLWTRYGRRVNLGLFFQVTAIFLFVFVVQLLISSIHEMSEQGYLPYSEFIHAATESWGPDSVFGHTLTYLLVILPLGWLLLARGGSQLRSAEAAGVAGAAGAKVR